MIIQPARDQQAGLLPARCRPAGPGRLVASCRPVHGLARRSKRVCSLADKLDTDEVLTRASPDACEGSVPWIAPIVEIFRCQLCFLAAALAPFAAL